jgi:hypothetical protein
MVTHLTEPLRRRQDELRPSVERIAHAATDGVTQLGLRLGYRQAVQPTRRRPLSDVVLIDEA